MINKEGSMTVAVSVHGINSRDGGKMSIDRVALGMAVDIVDTDDADYDWTLFFKTVLFKRIYVERVAGGIKKWVDDPRVKTIFLPVHSNGLNYALQALKLLAKRNQLNATEIVIISFSGCANRKVNTDVADQVYNCHTKHDGWLKLAKWSPSWTMGSFGLGPYRGDSANVIDKDYAYIAEPIKSHSGWFYGHQLSRTIRDANQIVKQYGEDV